MARQNLARPRGPLPASVYWRRRILVLGVALLLVIVVGKLLTGSSDGSSDGEAAIQNSSAEDGDATSATTDGASDPSEGPTDGASDEVSIEPTEPTKEPLPDPEGECDDSDIIAKADIDRVIGGEQTDLPIIVNTRESEACIWKVSPETLTLTMTSGPDRIWTTQQCPKAVQRREVVVRRDTETTVDVSWSARRSDSTCSRSTDWALPGWYQLKIAALGGEPYEDSFELVAADSEKAKAEKKEQRKEARQEARQQEREDKKNNKQDKQDKQDKNGRPGDTPTDNGSGTVAPSGAVEPDLD